LVMTRSRLHIPVMGVRFDGIRNATSLRSRDITVPLYMRQSGLPLQPLHRILQNVSCFIRLGTL
jgi:hypothetical protein